jgi:putative Holliday junction resolvase
VTRLLALDVGERRIGVAVADSVTGMVRPLVALRRRTPGADTRSLAALIAEQRIDELVVGLPLELRGGEGGQVERTRQWATQVLAPLGRPVSWRDERLTSVAAEAALGRVPRGASGGPPSAAARGARRARVDREAAALIAQAELDARAGRR